MPQETSLYAPVKALFEAQGFVVKGEVGAADVVAIRGEEEPVIVELKLRLSLSLYHQAMARLRVSDLVYIAVPKPKGKTARRVLRDNITMCRRLGLGLITVKDTRAEVQCEPGPYSPRKSKKKAARLVGAFDRLDGDPNSGGATRFGLVTGYRQDALKLAALLAEKGPQKGASAAKQTGVPTATRIMADNHYGWFERLDRGVYGLTATGSEGLKHWAYSWDDGES